VKTCCSKGAKMYSFLADLQIADILQSISLIIAAWAVIVAVTAWRRGFVGKRRIELAEEVPTLFYEARDVICYIRNPFAFAGEASSRKVAENELPEEKEIYDRAFIVFERYDKNKELFSKIASMRYRFMAQFGDSTAKPFDDLRKIANDIFCSARLLSYLWLQKSRATSKTEEEHEEHLTKIHEHETVFWKGPAGEDPITPRLNVLISEIEHLCDDIIGKQTLVQRLWRRIHRC